ncbi:MAG: DUF6414 family protein [Egibacteraceae bacterium]
MLRRFLYLDERALESYLGAVEGGLSDEMLQRRKQRGGRGGNARTRIGAISAGISGEREDSQEDERRIRETPEQRFDRLMGALEATPDEYGYEQVLDIADAFERLPVGLTIAVDCEIEVPPTVQLFAQPDQLEAMLGLMSAIKPLARLMGENIEGLPDEHEVAAVRDFVGAMKSDLVIVGEQEDDAPKVAGKLDKRYVRDLPEGEARVVGKVARRWSEGESHSLLALPGASLLPRKERRRAAFGTADEDSVLRGPALTLDILAIYR